MSASHLLRLLLSASLLFATTAQAQLFRSYLSSTGNDTNPCTVQAPCRLLPAALSAVKDGGEVWMMDSANFNTAPVLIDKSVSILAIPGALASIVGNGGDAVFINAPGAKVALRNLKILNLSGGLNGIHIWNSSGATVTVENCEVAGFTTGGYAGINVRTSAKVTIVDTTVRDNNVGILFDNGAKGAVARATAVGNLGGGIQVFHTTGSAVSVTVADSLSSHNSFGFSAWTFTATPGQMTVSRSTAAHNSHSGFHTAGGGSALMVVSGSVASQNGTGFYNISGTLRSLEDNTVFDNTTDTSGTITVVAGK